MPDDDCDLISFHGRLRKWRNGTTNTYPRRSHVNDGTDAAAADNDDGAVAHVYFITHTVPQCHSRGD